MSLDAALLSMRTVGAKSLPSTPEGPKLAPSAIGKGIVGVVSWSRRNIPLT
jgi:hypothetical protein